MTATPAALLCAGAALAVLEACRSPAEGPGADPTIEVQAGQFRGWRLVAAASALGVATALLLGGVVGAAAGIAAGIGAHRGVRRLEPAAVRRTRERRAAELPLVLDLLAVCLRAGMPLVGALEAVAEALPGPFSGDLSRVAGLLRLGSPPTTAWSGLAQDPDLAAVAAAAGRSAESGSRLAASFERLAVERRSALAAAGEASARKAGVVAMAPLALCFLPAFVCLGLVPIVLSLASEVLP
jgi:pilus assembly protein TadC